MMVVMPKSTQIRIRVEDEWNEISHPEFFFRQSGLSGYWESGSVSACTGDKFVESSEEGRGMNSFVDLKESFVEREGRNLCFAYLPRFSIITIASPAPYTHAAY